MRKRVVAGGLVIAVAVSAYGILHWWHQTWEIPRGVIASIPAFGAELFHISADQIVRRGSPRVMVMRVSGPANWVPHHYAQHGLSAPLTIEEWSAYLKAPVVFNAGQYDADRRYLGWLKSGGQWLFDKRKPGWMGLLVSGPVQPGTWAQVVDLEQTDAAIVDNYRHVVQSMMLVDHTARVRVRDTDLAACRTVVAQDSTGRLLVLLTEGAVTLADLARWLPRSGLGIVRAMNLDGGLESQMAVRTPTFSMATYGQYGTGTTVFESGGASVLRYPLPAVIAIQTVARQQ